MVPETGTYSLGPQPIFGTQNKPLFSSTPSQEKYDLGSFFPSTLAAPFWQRNARAKPDLGIAAPSSTPPSQNPHYRFGVVETHAWWTNTLGQASSSNAPWKTISHKANSTVSAAPPLELEPPGVTVSDQERSRNLLKMRGRCPAKARARSRHWPFRCHVWCAAVACCHHLILQNVLSCSAIVQHMPTRPTRPQFCNDAAAPCRLAKNRRHAR